MVLCSPSPTLQFFSHGASSTIGQYYKKQKRLLPDAALAGFWDVVHHDVPFCSLCGNMLRQHQALTTLLTFEVNVFFLGRLHCVTKEDVLVTFLLL